VSFYWAESSLLREHGVPEALTDKLDHYRMVMRGTDQKQPRCVALQGNIGRQVSCSIYDRRPAPCREFDAGTERCISARIKHGLADYLPEICA
jgi:hypothetical protein